MRAHSIPHYRPRVLTANPEPLRDAFGAGPPTENRKQKTRDASLLLVAAINDYLNANERVPDNCDDNRNSKQCHEHFIKRMNLFVVLFLKKILYL